MFFRFLLLCVGMLLKLTCVVRPRMRAQLGRNMVVAIGSRDGVWRTYVFDNRRVSSLQGRSSEAHSTLIFSTSGQGARILLARDGVAQIMEGLALRNIDVEGDLPAILWFYEMVMAYVPGRNRSSHRKLPEAYIKPDPGGKVSDLITRESATGELDPEWTQAAEQRSRIVLWEVGCGAEVPGKAPAFMHIVDPDTVDAESADSELANG